MGGKNPFKPTDRTDFTELRLQGLGLQFFAKEGPGGEKTEEPTGKKLSDARNEGQVAKSKEIANATGLIAMFLILKFGIGYFGNYFLQIFSLVYVNKIQYCYYNINKRTF